MRTYNKEISIVQNMDFGHTEPQILMPYGNRINLDSKRRKILRHFNNSHYVHCGFMIRTLYLPV
ncbi:hypothetical protein GW766_00950 [Candidatus Parcubacteria bacterium]|nr:hypothetical protein [Candidatus Parcubacteria bacterium]